MIRYRPGRRPHRTRRHWFGADSTPQPAPTAGPDDAASLDRLHRFNDALNQGRAVVGDAAIPAAASHGDDPPAAPTVLDDAAAFSRRLRVVAIAVALLFVGLIGRAFSLQVVQHNHYQKLWQQSQVRETLPAVRGSIVDRNGEVFAITRLTGKSLYVVPRLLEEPRRSQVARLLAMELGLDADRLIDRLRRYADKQFLWVQRKLTDDQEERIAPIVKEDAALGFRDETIRLYPQGPMAAQVIGFTGTDGDGLEGLELRYDTQLTGVDGSRQLLRDARGHRLDMPGMDATPAMHGASLILTIDRAIQAIVEEELEKACAQWKPKTATAIVMNPHTGEILAMASRPTFDPANRRGSTPEQWRNRAIGDVFEPGSIFKPCVMLAALEHGNFRLPAPGTPLPKDPREAIPGEDSINCENGAWLIRSRDGRAKRVLHDVHGYGLLPLSAVIIKSSNIGMAKVGRSLGDELLSKNGYIARFGFGHALGIDLPGEADGFLPPKEYYPDVFTIPSVSMGHSIGVTPLQVLTCFNQVANGGYILQPVVVARATDSRGTELYKVQLPRVISRPLTREAAREWMINTLVRVCHKGGTAANANLDDFGITVAGKTGTAEKVVGGKYSSEHKVCSFLAFAPAEAPQISVLVTMDEPTVHFEKRPFYGGTVAAPAVRNVILRALRGAKSDDCKALAVDVHDAAE
ncbi:MAG: peptidoglycan D,D-transpeptidase FtsI family protein [Planctomycetota bacterium]